MTDPGRQIWTGMLHLALSSINRIAAQARDLRQLQNVASLARQQTHEAPVISFVQTQQDPIYRRMFFGDLAIRMLLTGWTPTLMQRSF